ncbi:hypothetical protein SLA2020_521170 [Shorea laevis]
MALRRRQPGMNSMIAEPMPIPIPPADVDVDTSSSSSSLAAKAIRASSAANKDSSLSSAYASLHSSSASPLSNTSSLLNTQERETEPHGEYTSEKGQNESKQGFWGSLARKAKAFLDDDDSQPQQFESGGRAIKQQMSERPAPDRYQNAYQAPRNHSKTDSAALQKGLGAITSSLNYIGNAVEEGFTIVENRTAGIIEETRKHIRKKPSSSLAHNQAAKQLQVPQMQTDQEIQLKASRDVAMAMAAKAKLLLRELKTVKADLAFAKERCAQLEEENRILRENRERGDNPEDDDMIRLQLETLLTEKARLAHENSVYTRENRFLREVVEYHQLTMQDVVYLDERTEEVTEVYPDSLINTNAMTVSAHPMTQASNRPSNATSNQAP